MEFLKKLFIGILILGALGFLWFSIFVKDKYSVPILMYHHVSSANNANMNNVTPGAFLQQMKYLQSHGFKVISLDALVTALTEHQTLDRNSVVLTFDDGYINNYTEAYPILKELGYPATIFMVSDLVGTPGYMKWDHLKEMMRHGITIGSHTRHHAYLPEVYANDIVEEIGGSKKILEEGLGQRVDYFSYPTGGFTQEIKEKVKQAGYKGACTTNRGDDADEDVFELRRIRINTDESNFSLWAKLSGYYNAFRKPKKSH